jgi:hypothetical protein
LYVSIACNHVIDFTQKKKRGKILHAAKRLRKR